jgi:hypothetical protein
VIGDPFSAKRCLAFGYLLPVNSKNADAGIRQRPLFSKCRPSDRKLKTGAPPGRPGGKLKAMGTSSISFPAARITGVVDPDVVCLRQIEIALSARNSKLQSLHHFAVIGPTDVLLIIVTHLANVRSVSG